MKQKNPETQLTQNILKILQKQFYHSCPESNYYRDRTELIHAITWPAGWLQRRGLLMNKDQYQSLILDRLQDIQTHGCPVNWRGYFPAYLLKCIQKWFHYNGEHLYHQLKHIRNYLCTLQLPQANTDHLTEILARTHDLLQQKRLRHKRSSSEHCQQLKLFLKDKLPKPS